MKVRLKEVLLDAHVWDPDALTPFPDWLAHRVVRPGASDMLVVQNGPRQVTAARGDIIVKYPDGRCDAINRRAFENSYDVVPDREVPPAGVPAPSPEVTFDAVSNIPGTDVSMATVRAWSDDMRREAIEWVKAMHHNAMETGGAGAAAVPVPPTPAHVNYTAPTPPEEPPAAA